MLNMFDCIPFGVYIVDKEGNYMYANSAYLQSIGMKRQDIQGRNVHDFLKAGEIDFCVFDTVKQHNSRQIAIQDVNVRDGLITRNTRHLIVSTPIFDEEGNIENVIAVCQQITDLEMLFSEAHSTDPGSVDLFSTITKEADQSITDHRVIAESSEMKKLLAVTRMIAMSDASVLIMGETGAGKEVIAQYIHANSRRSKEPLVVINCASLPENLLEAELFGYEQGAFTGAQKGGKKGLIEEADGGTLFLDEINSFPYALQGKLLRVLETKMCRRVGATKSKPVNFRLLSASNADLEESVKKQEFRADLYYRLSVVPVKIPPLRERKEDVLPLANRFLSIYNEQYHMQKRLSKDMERRLLAYSWPGNVRELKNVIERSIVMSSGDVINIPVFSDMARDPFAEASSLQYERQSAAREAAPVEGESLTDFLERCEKKYLENIFKTGKSTYEIAEISGLSQSGVMRRKKKYGL